MAVLGGGIAVDLSRRIRPLFSFPNPTLPSIQRRSPATFRSPPSCRIPCFRSSGKLERNAGVADEEDVVTKFDPEGFAVLDRVSVGLAGRADEAIFEAIVTDPDSPLYDMKVVLRQHKTVQAQRRGKRALQVLKRLARRRLLYHSYAMQVHGYVFLPSSGDLRSFTLVHGYHGSYSLKHWLQLSDWLPTLEATLELDEEWVRRIGDDTLGGPALTRQLRLTRILMRDLLIGVNYLHSHGLAHTELRLENVHICPVDRHVKVGILGNAADFCDGNVDNTKNYADRRQLMIAYDMRCVGFMMAKMVLRELLDPEIFTIFKSFLSKGGSPSCLREFLLPFLCRNHPSGNHGLQMLDRNWGAGWNLLSMLLATKPSQRISCLNALRHPFLCGPRWRVDLSMDVIRWGLGSTAVRITEEYIYGFQQRSRLAYLIELMEMLNPNPKLEDWKECLPGRWRLLYSTGRQVGLTLREAKPRVLIDNLHLTFTDASETNGTAFSISSDIGFRVISTPQWPHKKSGIPGSLRITSPSIALEAGSRAYLKEETQMKRLFQKNVAGKVRSRIWKHIQQKEPPFNLPTAKLTVSDIEITMSLDATFSDTSLTESILREVRIQIPPEAFDVSKIVCGTYVDSRLMVLRGVNGSALLFTRSVCL